MSTWMDAPTTSSSSSSSSASPSLKGFAENATQAVAAGVNFSMANHTASPPGYETGAKFNPSMAIIIVVLLGTFFFMAFLSIYVKKCVTTESDMEHHHVPTSWAVDHSTGMRFSTQSHHGNLLQVQQQQQQQHQTGLDKASIQALPIVGFTKSKECCVCLAEFQENECVRLLPRCGHTFHVECIDLWLVSHTTCPLCRFKLTADNVVADTAALHPLESVPQQQQREESYLPVSIQPEVPNSTPQNSVQRASHPHSGQHLHQHQQLQHQQAAPEDGSSPSPSIAINISDLEQGMIDQECGDEQQQQQQQQHNAGAPSLLLKVLKVFRSWRAGLRATIAGNRIFS